MVKIKLLQGSALTFPFVHADDYTLFLLQHGMNQLHADEHLADVTSSKGKLHKVTSLTIYRAQLMSDSLPYVEIVVFIICVLFVKQRSVLRGTDNELVSHCCLCCYGIRM